jgi:hypothetical protein
MTQKLYAHMNKRKKKALNSACHIMNIAVDTYWASGGIG